MDIESENVNKKSKIAVNHEKTTQNDIDNITGGSNKFTDRTDEASALQYFQFYGYLSQQQNMMQDFVRTATYQKAILSNLSDFQGKIILDVGAGSGILSFFAIQAGAKRVYSIEASSMATFAKNLSDSNYGPLNCDLIYPGKVNKKESHDKKLIRIIAGKVEEIGTDEIPEEIDIIVSEPMGYMLFNERMLESFLHAKKFAGKNKKLKMYPSKGDLHVAPFSDESLFLEQINKANFWQQTNFHGINLSSLHESALDEYFKQPIVDTFDTRILMARSIKHRTDFETAHENDLHLIKIPLEFEILETGHIHGLAFWFDVEFNGSDKVVWLSTAPVEPLTHWYQVRCLVKVPILAKQGDTLRGSVTLTANKKQSYDVEIDMTLQTKILMTNGSENLLVYEQTAKNSNIDLKNPYFRYTGQIQIPPGHQTVSPSDNQNQMTWNSNSQMIAQNQQQIFLNPSTSQTQPSNIFAFNPQANCVIGGTGATMQTTNLIGGLNLNNENLIGIPTSYDPLISLPQQEQLILINNK